ncbi:hypothetical protein [Picosynechococcus sp. PCC 7117]|uniref:hypothetical protein n=1 Tax=Picosynechococcus sp. PCC 7117 TaxID=195498 RepID=UPI000810BE5A|nr:hypothetical protein [Picosynechococcus sp. PCC 7117]ANV88170.1 hypothetical protein AWQ22_12265 [Picosynechococcus sp. PCC 7117]
MAFYKQISAFCSAASLLTIPLAIAPAQAQQNYPLTCRGGGNLSITNTSGNNVKIVFRPATGSAPQGLQPGECSWQDRALRPEEPNVICDTGVRAAQYLPKLMQSSESTTFRVFNDNTQGCMQVVGLGAAPVPPTTTNANERARNPGTPNTNPATQNTNNNNNSSNTENTANTGNTGNGSFTSGNPSGSGQFRPALRGIWETTYSYTNGELQGSIDWGLSTVFGPDSTDFMTITTEGWDANQNAYVIKGTVQLGLLGAPLGGPVRDFEMTFTTPCQFEGVYGNSLNRPIPWSGTCR